MNPIDGARTGIERLIARLAADGLTMDARVGDYTTLPWPDRFFDDVIDNVSLCSNRSRTVSAWPAK